VRVAYRVVVVDHPAQLERGEVRRDGKAGELLEQLHACDARLGRAAGAVDAKVAQLLLKERDEVFRPRVVPHDRAAERLARCARPSDGRFALVRHA
jgi:hypothetical protein